MPQPQPPEKNKQELHQSIQDDFKAQSATLSTITRAVTGVILGTTWAICYKENAAEIPNFWILLSIIISVIFILVELVHYYVDANFYHGKSDFIVESKGNFDYDTVYNEVHQHSKCSFNFLRIKAGIVFILGIIFIIGICCIFIKQ